MRIYQRIKDLREDTDTTQKEIAIKLNMHKTQYCRYENGVSTVPLDFAIELAKYYNVSIDYIAGLTNSKGGLHKINNDEQKIIDIYNSLSEKNKGKLELLLEQLQEQQNIENEKNKEVV